MPGDTPQEIAIRAPNHSPARTPPQTTLVFGHKSPDTDSTGSPIIWAWYLNEIKGGDCRGRPARRTQHRSRLRACRKWDLPKPRIIDGRRGRPTRRHRRHEQSRPNCPMPSTAADIQAIIDHHKLVGGLETKGPIDIRIEPLACTATIMWKMIGKDMAQAPKAWVKGTMLSCILSRHARLPLADHDTGRQGHRSRSGQRHRHRHRRLMPMRCSKPNPTSRPSADADLLRMDSKEYEVGGTKFRVSVLETTAPKNRS